MVWIIYSHASHLSSSHFLFWFALEYTSYFSCQQHFQVPLDEKPLFFTFLKKCSFPFLSPITFSVHITKGSSLAASYHFGLYHYINNNIKRKIECIWRRRKGALFLLEEKKAPNSSGIFAMVIQERENNKIHKVRGHWRSPFITLHWLRFCAAWATFLQFRTFCYYLRPAILYTTAGES